ncbi:SNARE associated Golgi protein, putative, partial [Plasmodium malariae]
MENGKNMNRKKYEYLNNNYSTIYNEEDREGELLNKNYDASTNYDCDHNLMDEDKSNIHNNHNIKEYSNIN